MSASQRLPTYFISHGGGPWPWLKKEMPYYAQLEASLRDIPLQLATRPKAIVMISAHWEESDFAVMAHPHPPMIYDYGGFPEHTYHVQYPAPGAPHLANSILMLLRQAGLKAHLDFDRGFDHGTFSPLAPMYPNADVPVVQVSLRKDYDPAVHIQLGRALAPLREQGVLILASGLSYHNLRLFGPNETARTASRQFDQWLRESLALPPEQRLARLLRWDLAPSARLAHPREDHLLPLMVALGAAETEAMHTIYHEEDFMGALSVSSFRFGF